MIQKSNFYSIPRQKDRLLERHAGKSLNIDLCGMSIIVDPGVYQTSGDSELMAESVAINFNENFLEIGCGTGIVSLVVAKRAAHGVGVDINARAVANSQANARTQGITNVNFIVSDVFENVVGEFDVIICNPPYTNHDAKDEIDRMFWDPNNEMKKKFFERVVEYLKPGGRVYFGWADFADIDVELPHTLAKENNLELVRTYRKPHHNNFIFFVFEFKVVIKGHKR